MTIHMCKADASDKRYCFVTRHASPYSYPLSYGVPVQPALDENGDELITLDIDEIQGALELPDLVGNIQNYLLMRKACADKLLQEFEFGPHEVVPATLMNAKGRVHAADYVIINPHGKVECLDEQRSEMDGDDDDPAVRLFGKFWLKNSLLPADRDVFRVQGIVSGYMYSERLVAFIRKQGFTNFVFHDVQLS